jgi:hypothetical protein
MAFSTHALRFGAVPVATVQLPQAQGPSVQGHVVQLTGSPSDVAFLEKGLAHIKQLEATGDSVVPVTPGVDVANHQELAQEAFVRALSLLQALNAGQITHPPLVFAVLDDTKKLLGLSINHIERLQADGTTVYSPLKGNRDRDKLPKGSPVGDIKHSSSNWLVSLSPLQGVGKALMSAYDYLLPKTVKRVDVVSELPEYTPSAMPFYKRYGFVAQLADAVDYADIHGMPMIADRADFAQQAEADRQALQFTPASHTANYDLAKDVILPAFKTNKPSTV